MVGETNGSLGGPNTGSDDAFLAKYTANGTQEWVVQSELSGNDLFMDVAADQDGVYVASVVLGCEQFLAKYTFDGLPVWSAPVDDWVGVIDLWAVAADGLGGVYALGHPEVSPGRAYVSCYDSDGTHSWTMLVKPDAYASYDMTNDDQGYIYATGSGFMVKIKDGPAIPEPGTWTLLVMAIVCLQHWRLRRR